MTEEEQKDFAFQRFLESVAPPAKAAAVGMGAMRSVKAAQQLAKNRAVGAAFEAKKAQDFAQQSRPVVPQVTVKTQSGTKFRLDFVEIDPATGAIIDCHECKGTATAPFTPKQRQGFPEMAKTGATVVGKGKPGAPGGTVISPMTTKIHRP
jgi:filamentous hemagglutinin